MASQVVDDFVDTVNTARENFRKETDIKEVRRYFGAVLNLLFMMGCLFISSWVVASSVAGFKMSPYPGAITVTIGVCAVLLRSKLKDAPLYVVTDKDFLSFASALRRLGIVTVFAVISVFGFSFAEETVLAQMCYGALLGYLVAKTEVVLDLRTKVLRKLQKS
ncbi:MAG: hypothetical protein V4690_01650 [Patescibacteria group bacterium]